LAHSNTNASLITEVLLAPRCSETRLHAISELPDARQSLATLHHLPSGGQRTLRMGGSLGAYRVAHIGQNRALGAPSVWLWDGSALCQALLDRAHHGPRLVAKVDSPAPSPARVPPNLSGRVAQAVSVRGNNHRAVPKALVQDVLDHIGELGVERRWVSPSDGSEPGWQLGFAPGSTLESLGLRDGDRLLQLNQLPLASPKQALQAYMRLREAPELEAVVLRQGNRVKLTISVE
jgi:general secretion pathway protein C